ncbi:MOSC domain-containing protein YiiM [Agrobacterium vitis]|nr:MOSC domain-containing protein YiiM [Agrobacterium vitis]MBE1437546.1 MOSC domain-containing protein YiiM [Agrobacterium vitis]
MSRVESVSLSSRHAFSKERKAEITLLAGLGVEGDTHLGVTVQHRSRVAKDPTQPNLRQVHLMQGELLDELAQKGFVVGPADMGENILTRGIDVLALPRGAKLHLGEVAVVEVTGLRNPCKQINDFQPGLMQAVLDYDADGRLIRKAGVMAIVLTGGVVRVGDTIHVVLPDAPHQPLEAV